MKDIENKGDIETLVNVFYDRVKNNFVIGPIFHQIVGSDWSHHLPVMYNFWEMVLFSGQGYTGNPVKKHIEIDKIISLQQEHFQQWLSLWNTTVDNLFAGPKANEAKKRAMLMLQLIEFKVNASREGNFIH